MTINKIPTYTLSVTKNTGGGSGTVKSDVGGIDCGSTCSTSYNRGTIVKLTATSNSDSTFAGWGGACSGAGTATTCTVTMDAAKTATVTFNLIPFDYSFSAPGVTITQGDTAQQIITITKTQGTAQAVTVNLGNLPAGITLTSANSQTCTPTSGSCALTFSYSATTSATVGTSSISTTAKSAGLTDKSNTFSLTVNKKPNQSPTVSITSPANGASFTEIAEITIKADASDSDGTIKKVEFYNGVTKLGEDASAPYEINWENVLEGTYEISVKVIDNELAIGTSEKIAIIVKKPEQQLLSCSGQEPEPNEGTIKGLSQYLSGTIQVTSWTYSPAADLTTPCLWKCDANLSYSKDENRCIFKTILGFRDIKSTQNGSDLIINDVLNNQPFIFIKNINVEDINISNILIIRSNKSDNFAYLILINITLPQNKTKSIYIMKSNADSNGVCLADVPQLESKDDLAAICQKILCPSSSNIYNCSLENNYYIISGLRHSGVIENIVSQEQQPQPPSGGGGGTAEQTYVVNFEQLQKSAAKELAINDKIKFDAFGNSIFYLATLLEVRKNSAVVKLSKIDGTEIMRMEILLKEQKKVNLDSDNYYDLIIRVENISLSDKKSNLSFMYLKEEIIILREEEQERGIKNEPELEELPSGGLTNEEGNKIPVYLILTGVILALVGVILSIYKILMLKRLQGLSYKDLKRAKEKAKGAESI